MDNRTFLSQFLNSTKPKFCVCLKKSMDSVLDQMIESEMTFSTVQSLIQSVPPDLTVICEDINFYLV